MDSVLKETWYLSPAINLVYQKTHLSRKVRHEKSFHYSDKKNHPRICSDDRDKNHHGLSRNKENRRDRLLDHRGHSSSNHLERKNYSTKRRSSYERSSSEDRKRRNSDHDHSSRDQEHRRSREKRERKRSFEQREHEKERSRERRMPTLPHYIEQVPVPVYYGNFPPRPVIMGPMMPRSGPFMRNIRFPVGPRVPFLPRFMHPNIFRPSLPAHPRFNPMF